MWKNMYRKNSSFILYEISFIYSIIKVPKQISKKTFFRKLIMSMPVIKDVNFQLCRA